MVRLQLLVPLMLWAAWRSSGQSDSFTLVAPLPGTLIYFLALAAILLAVRMAARRAMRRHAAAASAGISRLHQTIFAARWLILGLHTFALYCLGFGELIWRCTPDVIRSIETLPAIASLLPVAAAWLGLVWAEHPLDRAVREQNAVFAFEFGEPVYPIPTFSQQILTAFRLQILFTLVPVLLISLTRDILVFILLQTGHPDADRNDLLTSLIAVGGVFVLSPELLRRVLPTHSLPASELREGLEALCRRVRLRYRDILLWRTHHTLDNAAVMGIVPQVRYILLSDLLIATMTQQQIEAVFAHEAGHVKHRHMTWYLMFFTTLVLGLNILAAAIGHQTWLLRHFSQADLELLVTLLGVIGLFVLFGALSRNMERQADVFAARTMTADAPVDHVGRDGAAVFCSALATVARVNNMPLDGTAAAFGQPLLRRLWARLVSHSVNWLHGSIRSRLDYLQSLIDAPERLAAFDRKMLVIRFALLASFVIAAGWTALASWG